MRLRDHQDKKKNRYKVMIIDDDPGIIDTVKTILDSTKYFVSGHTDPFIAIKKIQEEHFDILILDFLLEKTTGKKVVEYIRKFNTELYILLLTGYKDMAPPLETLQHLDIQGYCEKGSKFNQLIILVESAVKAINLSRKLLKFHDGMKLILDSAPRMYKLRPVNDVVEDIFQQLLQITESNNGFLIISTVNSIKQREQLKVLKGSGIFNISPEELYLKIKETFNQNIEKLFETNDIIFEKNTVFLPLVNDLEGEFIALGVECDVTDDMKDFLNVFLSNAKSSYNNAILHTIVNKKNRDLSSTMNALKENIEKQKQLEREFHQIQKMEVLGRLTGGIAHDFNNILTVILTYSNLLLKRIPQNSPDFKKISNINDAGIRARDLVKQLLAFSRKQKMEKSPVDINQIINSFINMIERTIGVYIEVKCDLQENVWKTFIDKIQFEQVIMNLAVNAKDAMPNGGTLTISTKNITKEQVKLFNRSEMKLKDYIQIDISDTGFGIKPEIISNIFDPFFTTKEQGKGTGLGLSTVYGIIKQMDGNIYVRSEIGKGTTFTIYLPKTEKMVEEIYIQQKTAINKGNETILVVDDEKEIEICIGTILLEEGYTVINTSSAKEAISLYEKESVDLVLTDMVMPEMSGRKLINMLQKINPDLKFLFMSGYINIELVEHGFYYSPSNFIEKPFKTEDLLYKIREILDQRKLLTT
jgi:signal transduction histidine kinase/FixJ family two-component response regulator